MKQFILFARPYTWLCLLIPVIAQAQIDDNPYPNYVVIGAFAKQKNAVKFTNDANKNKFPARFEMNHNRNLYYVYVLTSQDREYAISEALKLREETTYFDTWVYSGSFGLMEVAPGQQNQDVNPVTGKKIDAVAGVQRNNEAETNVNLTDQVSSDGVAGNGNGNDALANPFSGENTKTSTKQSSRRQRRQSSRATANGVDRTSETSFNDTAALHQSPDQLTSNKQTAREPVSNSNKAAVAGVSREGQQSDIGKANARSSENIRTGPVSTRGGNNKEQNGPTVAAKNASPTTGAGEAIEGDSPSLDSPGSRRDITNTGKTSEKTNGANLNNGKTNGYNSETGRRADVNTTVPQANKLNQSVAEQEVGGDPLSNNTARTTENTTSSPSTRNETAEKSQLPALVNAETKQGRAQEKVSDREKIVTNSDADAVNADQLKAMESTTGTEARKKTSGTIQQSDTRVAGPVPVSEADTAAVVRTVPKRITTAPLSAEEVVGKTFYFQLYRADNQEVVEGEVDAIDFEKARRMATYPANAPVKVLMPQGKSKQISFVCQVFGYRKLQKEFDRANPAEDLYLDENGNFVVPFELIRLQKGDIAIMYNVFFFKDAAVMRPESRFEVNNLLDLLNENPSYKIRIHGHTNGNAAGKIIRMGKPDNFYSLTQTKEGFGSAKKLSEERAIVIRDYLISSGISADRMQVKAWGGKKPIHDKHAARAQENVRVEIEILSDP
jgi:outer membrane protein OmpA-like peptidoglycan-associated protein